MTNTEYQRADQMTTCKNCNIQLNENFCANCGQPAKIKRIDNHYISHEVLHLLHFEKGFFYTVKNLILRPGDSIKEFVTENRTKHMKPVVFLILTSLLFTLVAHIFHTDEIYNDKEKLLFAESSIGSIMHWVQTHYGYANIIMGVFIAFCVKVLFRKYKYNLFEITVLLCFVMGQGMLLLTLETLFVGVLNEKIYKAILVIIAFAYPTWAIGQFFAKKRIGSYVKAFLAYLLGYVVFYIAIIVVGLTVDLAIKTF